MVLRESNRVTTETINQFKKLVPDLIEAKEVAENMVDELQERRIFLQNQIEKANATFEMWKLDFKTIHDMEMQKLDEKRLKIC